MLNVVEKIDDAVFVRRVLASVSDKRGLDKLIPGLVAANPTIEIYSTGGTYDAIEAMLGRGSRNLVRVSDYTAQPEMQGGLVKTLDFKIYLGLLSETYNVAHVRDLARVQAQAIDLVVVNLYPFQQTVAKAGCTPEMARGNIDIGGPCMVRASAKNFLRVASVTDPADYDAVLAELNAGQGRISLKTRYALAAKAFAHTAAYDTAIAEYWRGQTFESVARCYSLMSPAEPARV